MPYPDERGRWLRFAYAFSLVVAAGLCYFLARMPLQVSDNVALIMIAQAQSARQILTNELTGGAWNVRPLLELTVNLAFEIARLSGHYFLTFKTIQIAQVLALLLLLTRLLRPQSWRECSAGALAVVAAVGMHTFFSTIYELYPINTYMTILVCCVLALNLSDGAAALWRDVAATALFVFALFTVETGVLVWVIITAGFIVGFRGVSGRGVAALSAVLLGYLSLKFFVLGGGMPALDQVSAAYGFTSYNQQQLLETFASRRLVFYSANVVSSVVTIFFAEPRAGLWRFVRAVVRGEVLPLAMLLNVVTSTASSLLIFWFIWTRRQAWLRLQFQRHDRFVLVFLAVVAANATMSFPYTKDAIMSPAGVLFPLALFAAVAEALLRLERERRRHVVVVASCALGLLSLGWTARAAAVPFGLLQTAYYNQQKWVSVDQWQIDQGLHYNAEQQAVIEQLRIEALMKDVPDSTRVGGWMKWSGFLFDRP